ncbi:MAG: hypothetical protein CR981_01595 [Proteobacteria bacterium]|nr:MAG: hypothetical protein CR981_01595 [Pseudomonadota bacterium]
MKPEDIKKSLQQSMLFKDIDPEQLSIITNQAEIRYIDIGDFVHRKGDKADTFYLVAIGEVELTCEGSNGVTSIVGRIGPGGHFGETSLLTRKPHNLSIRALYDLVLICFTDTFFHQLLRQHRTVQERIECALAERLRISFRDHAASVLAGDLSTKKEIKLVDMLPMTDEALKTAKPGGKKQQIMYSQSARHIQQAIDAFAKVDSPVLITGESGTGRRLIAKQIHLQGKLAQGPYIEIDIREFDTDQLDHRLFGVKSDPFPFSQVMQTGVFEQFCRGTVVLNHIERMALPIQKKLVDTIRSSSFKRIGDEQQVPLQARLIFISSYSIDTLKDKLKLLKSLEKIIENHTFHVPALRFHKRDLPQLVDYYIDRFNREHGKNVHSVAPETLGILMNYDWPGNLIELSAVIQRAVMLSRDDVLRSDHILLGLPKSEGKWEFNLLRIPWIKSLIKSKFYPALPRAIVGSVLLLAVLTLFSGPVEPDKNIGITISWIIGWPLMFFSFFFMARTWCSVCTLAMPGSLLQHIVKPTRNTPRFIKRYSGWIMSVLCIIVFWVEIVWNAYEKPHLSGWIILAITIGSLLFSICYKRRSWCRYLCPLGAINAIFAMPSILELRSNRHLCLNRCEDHACYTGMVDKEGCPMFRHPFMVDNNRDCIVCGECVKNCSKQSIHLNLRMAPQELWEIESPRRADSFLIISLGAIFFPFALHKELYSLIETLRTDYSAVLGLLPFSLLGSIIFFGLILIFQLGYYLVIYLQARLMRIDRTVLLPLLGYGFIPIILGVYLAVHFEVFVANSWRLSANIRDIFGMTPLVSGFRLISADASALIQICTVAGGFSASLFATYRIIDRVKGGNITRRDLVLPYSFLAAFTILFIFFMKTSKIIPF